LGSDIGGVGGRGGRVAGGGGADRARLGVVLDRYSFGSHKPLVELAEIDVEALSGDEERRESDRREHCKSR